MAARRLLLVWACWLISYTVIGFFDHIEDIGGAAATVITAVIGILTAVIGFYQRQREQEQ